MRENLKSLTSLRFFAAALVVVSHTGYFGYGREFVASFPIGLAVSFFFVLSGFVLFYSNPKITSMSSASDFLVARVARIWPAHFLMLILVILFLPSSWGESWSLDTAKEFLKNALLVQSWSHSLSGFFSFNAVSWSISTEMFFYAMFPILIWRWESTKVIKLLASAALVLACIASAASLNWAGEVAANVDSVEGYVYVFPPARLLEFLTGMLVADLWMKAGASNYSTIKATALQLISVSLIIFVVPAMHTFYAWLYEGETIVTSAFKWLQGGGYLLICAIVIFAMACMNGLIAQALSNRLLVILGEISYSVYLTHQVLLSALVGKLPSFGPMIIQYIVYWLIVVGFSFGVWALVEKPCRKMIVDKYKNLKQRQQSKVVAA